MNYIVNFLKTPIICNNKTEVIAQFKSKQIFFRINESLKINKLAFGYFIDRFPKRDMNSSEVKALSKYEWFAASLSTEQFSLELENFLYSPYVEELHPLTKEIIEKYVKNLQICNEEGYLIDLVRSSDLRLIFNIATGMYLGTSLTPNTEIVDHLSKSTLEKINSLTEGQKHLFLLGSAIHETRLTVERKLRNWEVCYYDSANSKFFVYECEERSSLFHLSFWETMYSYKFSPEYIEVSHSKAKFKTLIKVQQELDKIGKPIGYRNLRYEDAQSKKQQKNTCHFKSLLGVLKKEVIYSSKMEVNEAVEEWNHFKIAFGNFMLQNDSLDPDLKMVSEKKQIERMLRQEKRKEFSEIIKSGQYEETVNSFVAVIKQLSPLGLEIDDYVDPAKYSSKIKNLHYLHKLLENYLTISLIPLNKLQELKAKYKNFFLVSSINKYINDLYTKQKLIEKKLENEIHSLNCFDLIIEKAKDKLTEMTSDTMSSFKALECVPLNEKKVIEYLDLFLQNPSLLASLINKPASIMILLQAIQMGKIKIVKRIYDRFQKEEALLFSQILKMFLNQRIKDYSTIHL